MTRARLNLLHFLPVTLLAIFSVVAWARLDARALWLVPEQSFQRPDAGLPFGRGEGGVDLFALWAHAEWRSLLLAAGVASLSAVIGTLAGAALALRGKIALRAFERVTDVLQSLPTFLVAMSILAVTRHPSRWHIALAFMLTAWVPFARLASAETRVLRGQGFVEASRALGATQLRVLACHVVPNLAETAMVQWGSSAATLVVSEAGLAFVGLGPKDGVSLGAMLDQGVASMLYAPHVAIVATLSVFTTSLVFLTLGARGVTPA